MRRLSALLLASLALVACNADEPQEVSGTGYGYELPEGWENASGESEFEAGGFNSDSVVHAEPEEGFATNLNVIRETSLAPDLRVDAYSRAGLRLLRRPGLLSGELREIFEDIGAHDFSDTGTLRLDGEEARFTDYSSNQGGRALRIRSVSAIRRGTAYNISFAALRTHFEKDLDALRHVVRSWEWR